MVLNSDIIDSIYFYPKFIDMRKGPECLIPLIKELNLDIYSNSFFVFCGKNKKIIKIIYYDGTGIWMFYKKLLGGRFRWSPRLVNGVFTISKHELEWFLGGQKNWSPVASETYAKYILN